MVWAEHEKIKPRPAIRFTPPMTVWLCVGRRKNGLGGLFRWRQVTPTDENLKFKMPANKRCSLNYKSLIGIHQSYVSDFKPNYRLRKGFEDVDH